MAARGTEAKDYVTQKIQEAFGKDFLGIYDKKLIIQVPEGGETVQIAIALTCPKTPVAVSTAPVVKGDRMDFESTAMVTPVSDTPAQITDEERATVAELMRKLNL